MAAGLGFIEFNTGDILTAASANGYLASQTVMVFANSAARTSAIASPQEGMVSYLKDTDAVEKYNGSAWVSIAGAAPSGLTLIKTQTIGTTVSSVTVTDAFSSTYDNYVITIAGGAASTTQDLNLTFGSTGTGYYWAAGRFFPAGGSAAMASASNTVSFRATTYNAGNVTTKIEVQQPFLSKPTAFQSPSQTTGEVNFYQGILDNTTSYTAFTLTTGGGTLTGGTIRVYGYQNS
jgi:hypothetical protein